MSEAQSIKMYRYDSHDHRFVAERVAQFRDQTRRFLAGELTEDEFRPLRLQNGLYIQKYAPMLRISSPIGRLNLGITLLLPESPAGAFRPPMVGASEAV